MISNDQNDDNRKPRMGVISMINNAISSAVGSYAVQNFNQTSAKKPERTTAATAARSGDVFTYSAAEYHDRLKSEVSNIVSGVKSADDSARAKQIANRIKSGSYGVAAEEIARAILGIS